MDTMETRRKAIVELINQNGTVSFAQLKEAFPNTSEMTLRTDLKLLDEAKQIVRIHGGAKSVQVVIGTDDFLSRRSVRHIPEKKRLSEKALSLVHADTTIFIDSGSTTTIFSAMFPDQSNLIYTTGLSCATELAALLNPTVMIPGGILNRYSQSVYGIAAIRALEQVNFSQAFLGVTCYSADAGFTCGSMDEAALKQTAIRQSAQTVVLMDSSKTGSLTTFKICDLSDIDLLVSDGNLSSDFLEDCRRAGVTVL